jgi:hypothetical protein
LSDPMHVGYQNMPKRTLQVLGVALKLGSLEKILIFIHLYLKRNFVTHQ